MAGDDAGNTLNTARLINATSGLQSFRDRVNALDPNDYYRFSLDTASSLSLSLQSLSSDATLQVYNSGGTVVEASINPGTAAEALTTTLGPGTYYIQVSTTLPNADTDYQLNINLQRNANINLLWRDYATGRNNQWLMEGGNTPTSQGSVPIPAASPGWKMEAVADFNQDGTLDIVWREYAGGKTAIWYMGVAQGNSIIARGGLPTVNPSWRIEGAADFNQDGAIDLVWQNYITGATGVWLMNPSTPTAILSKGSLRTDGPNWRVSGVADFNLDGTVDVLVRNHATGANRILFMSSADPFAIAATTPIAARPSNWRIEGVVDVNRDSAPDILWRDAAKGTNEVWFMGGANNTTMIGKAAIPSTPTSWQMMPAIRSGPLPIADLAGNTPTTAFDIGSLNRIATYQDTIGSKDSNDYYRFTLENDSSFNLVLKGLEADADVQLLRGDGSFIQASTKAGVVAETISTTLNAGTYLVRIFPYTRDTSYTLNLSAEALPGQTTVSLATSDANAAETSAGEPTNRGQFRIFRTGSTSTALTVNYQLSGTATNGSDYTTLPLSVVIPVGESSVNLPIAVLDDVLREGRETVVLTLATGAGYRLGATRRGEVAIADNDQVDFTSFTITDASGDGTANTVFQGGALKLSYALPTETTVSEVTLEALQNNQVISTLGTWTTAALNGALINLQNFPTLAGGEYQFRAVAKTVNNINGFAVSQPFRILAWNPTDGTTFGKFMADTFTYAGTPGNGQIFVGRGGTDTLNLTGISRANVASLNGLALNNYNPLQSTGSQAIFRGTAFDYLALTDGREIYFQGIEFLNFADGTLSLHVTPNDSHFGKQWNLHITDVSSAWRFTQGASNILLVSWDGGIGGPVGQITDMAESRLIRDSRSTSDEVEFDGTGNRDGGHGHLAINVMSATANNGSGIAGINWNSRVLVHDVYGNYDSPAGTFINLTDSITEAVKLARQNGWKVVFQGGVQGYTWLDEQRSQLEQLIQKNSDIALFAVAAGNGALDIDDKTSSDSNIYGGGVASLQTTYGNVMAIGALRPGPSTNLWYESGRGVKTVENLTNATGVSSASYSNRGNSLTFLAPTDAPAMNRFGELEYFGGTSAANPNMAAIASLVWSVNSTLNATQLRQLLIDTAMDLGAPGKDPGSGYGLVNADAAVRRATALTRDGSLANLFTGRSEFA